MNIKRSLRLEDKTFKTHNLSISSRNLYQEMLLEVLSRDLYSKSRDKTLPFLFCLTLYLRAIFQVQAPWGLYLEGDLTDGFSRYKFGGLICGGAYT